MHRLLCHPRTRASGQPAHSPGTATPPVGLTGMMVTARVADFGLGPSVPPTGPSKLRLQAGKFWRFCGAETPISQKRDRELQPAALYIFSLSRRARLLLPPAAGNSSARACHVAAALQPCFQLARQLGSCSNELARCLRHAVMMRSPCRRSVSCELRELFLFPKPRVARF